MMVPVGRIILLRTIPKAELVDALAWLTIPALLGPLLGPPVGGFITDSFGWRWIFWMNVPFGIAAILLATWLMPETGVDHVPPLDVRGFLLSGLGLSSLIFGLTVLGRDLLPAYAPPLLMGFGLVMLVLYYLHARRIAAPILDFRLLRIPTFRAGVLGGSLFRIGVGAVPFLLPLMFQLGYGLSAFESGMITCAAAAGAISMKFGAARLIRRFGFRRLLLVNGALASVSIAVMGLLTGATPYLLMVALLFVGGFLRSLQFTAMNAMSYSDVDNDGMSYATSLLYRGRSSSRCRPAWCWPPSCWRPRNGGAARPACAGGFHHRLLRGGGGVAHGPVQLPQSRSRRGRQRLGPAVTAAARINRSPASRRPCRSRWSACCRRPR